MLFSLQYLYSPIWYSVSWLQTSLHVLLLLLSHFSCVRLCVTLETAATRLPHPWDSPGKNTGVGCHFLLQCRKVKSESEVAQSIWLFSTPCTAAYQAPPSMGFSRQEYWSGVPLPSLLHVLTIPKYTSPAQTSLPNSRSWKTACWYLFSYYYF